MRSNTPRGVAGTDLAGAAPRVWPRVSFVWDNSGNSRIAGLRRFLDGDTRRRFPCLTSVSEHHPLRIGYAGLGDGLVHVVPFLEHRRDPEGTARTVRRYGTLRWDQIVRGDLPDVDLLAIGVTERRAAQLPRQRAMVLPLRVNLVVPVVPDAARMRARISRKDRQHFVRQSRGRKWTWELTTATADFDDFYDNFHLPTMRRRHGAATRSVDRRTARVCLFRRGQLFFLREGERRVAGLLCRCERDGSLTLRLAGVRDGSTEVYRSGALMACYVYLLEWCAAQGVRRLDLSGCEPFLSKGIFQFKRKLHPEIVLPDTHFGGKRLWLGVRRDTPAVRDFLVANPVLAPLGGGGWEAVYFTDKARPARRDLRWEGPSVVRARVLDIDEFLGRTRTGWWAPCRSE